MARCLTCVQSHEVDKEFDLWHVINNGGHADEGSGVPRVWTYFSISSGCMAMLSNLSIAWGVLPK